MTNEEKAVLDSIKERADKINRDAIASAQRTGRDGAGMSLVITEVAKSQIMCEQLANGLDGAYCEIHKILERLAKLEPIIQFKIEERNSNDRT